MPGRKERMMARDGAGPSPRAGKKGSYTMSLLSDQPSSERARRLIPALFAVLPKLKEVVRANENFGNVGSIPLQFKLPDARSIIFDMSDSPRIKELANARLLDMRAIIGAVLDYAQECSGLPLSPRASATVIQDGEGECDTIDINLGKLREMGLYHERWPIPLTAAKIKNKNLPKSSQSEYDDDDDDDDDEGSFEYPGLSLGATGTVPVVLSMHHVEKDVVQQKNAEKYVMKEQREMKEGGDGDGPSGGAAAVREDAVMGAEPSVTAEIQPPVEKKHEDKKVFKRQKKRKVAAKPESDDWDSSASMEEEAGTSLAPTTATATISNKKNANKTATTSPRQQQLRRRSAVVSYSEYDSDNDAGELLKESQQDEGGSDAEQPLSLSQQKRKRSSNGSSSQDTLLTDEEWKKCHWLNRVGVYAQCFRSQESKRNPPRPLNAASITSCHDCQGGHARHPCDTCDKSYCHNCCRKYEYLFSGQPGENQVIDKLQNKFSGGTCPHCLNICVKRHCLEKIPAGMRDKQGMISPLPKHTEEEKRVMAMHMACCLQGPVAAMMSASELELARQQKSNVDVRLLADEEIKGFRFLCNRCAVSMDSVFVHCKCGADICPQCCADTMKEKPGPMVCPVCKKTKTSFNSLLSEPFTATLKQAHSVINSVLQKEQNSAVGAAYDVQNKLWCLPRNAQGKEERKKNKRRSPEPAATAIAIAVEQPVVAAAPAAPPPNSMVANGTTAAAFLPPLFLPPGTASTRQAPTLQSAVTGFPPLPLPQRAASLSVSRNRSGSSVLQLVPSPPPLSPLLSFEEARTGALLAIQNWLTANNYPTRDIASTAQWFLNMLVTGKLSALEPTGTTHTTELVQYVELMRTHHRSTISSVVLVTSNSDSGGGGGGGGGGDVPLLSPAARLASTSMIPPPPPSLPSHAAPSTAPPPPPPSTTTTTSTLPRPLPPLLPLTSPIVVPSPGINLTTWHTNLPLEDYRLVSQRPNGVQNYIWTPHMKDFAQTSPRRAETVKRFVERWGAGEPIIIRGMRGRMNWGPSVVMRAARHIKLGERDIDVIDCADWSTQQEISAVQFFKRYTACHGPTTDTSGAPLNMLKLRDFPAEDTFANKCQRHNADFLEILSECMPEYMHPTLGELNLASQLPSVSVPPDLGPKGYIAFGREAEHEGEEGDSVTRLHEDLSDAINIMCHTQHPPGTKTPPPARCGGARHALPGYGGAGAVWDLFRRQDSPNLRRFLVDAIQGKVKKIPQFMWKGEPLKLEDVHDVVHDQAIMITTQHRAAMAKAPYNVHPWVFEQYEHEGVVIPAGCSHQVRNLRASIKIALDFVTPEGVPHCLAQRERRRELAMQEHPVLNKDEDVGQRHFHDKLQVGNMVVHALKQALDVLQADIPAAAEKEGVEVGKKKMEIDDDGAGPSGNAPSKRQRSSLPLHK